MKIKKSFSVESSQNMKFIKFTPFILWFIENLERNEKISPKMNLEITLVKYSKIDKKHIRELEGLNIKKDQIINEQNEIIKQLEIIFLKI